MDIARAIMPQSGNMDTPADNGHEDMVMSEIEDQDQDENENENENKTKNEDQDQDQDKAKDVDADKRNIQETKGTKSKSITGKRKHAAMP